MCLLSHLARIAKELHKIVQAFFLVKIFKPIKIIIKKSQYVKFLLFKIIKFVKIVYLTKAARYSL